MKHNAFAILTEKAPKTEKKKRLSKYERKKLKSIQRSFKTYWGVKLHVDASDDGLGEMIEKTKLWFDKLKSFDERAIIYVFNDNEPTTAIITSNDIPKSVAPFKAFFNGANAKESEGHIWINIWMGHEEPASKLEKNLKDYARFTDTWSFVKKLQEKYISRDYFLLWSTDYIDIDRLTHAVHEALETNPDDKYSFSFSWTNLKDSNGRWIRGDKPDRRGNKFVKALVVAVPQNSKDQTYTKLNSLFGLHSTTPILGRPMIMVPITDDSYAIHKNRNI